MHTTLCAALTGPSNDFVRGIDCVSCTCTLYHVTIRVRGDYGVIMRLCACGIDGVIMRLCNLKNKIKKMRIR